MRSSIGIQFTVDESFQGFLGRHAVSKKSMGTFALLSVPWVALKLTELAQPSRVTGNHLFTVSFWVILLIPAEIILLFELLMSFLVWRTGLRLQRGWFHLLDGEWHWGDPTLHLSLHSGHADVTLVGYGPPADGREGKRPWQSGIQWALDSYREFTRIDGHYELNDVTDVVWGEAYALLLLGGQSRLFDTAEGASRIPVARARITPAVPVPLARMGEEDRRRLRRALDRRGIPVREVRDEGWARRALRALKVRGKERSR